MTHQYSIDQAKTNLDAMIQEVEQGTPVEIVRAGTRVAVLISGEDYDRLMAIKPDFWEALQSFRATLNLEEEGLDSDDLAGIRDSSPGREVNL